MLVQLHNSYQSYKSNNSYHSPDSSPCLCPLNVIRRDLLLAAARLKLLDRLLREHLVPDPANIADQRDCGYQVEPEIESAQVTVDGERGEQKLDYEESEGACGDSPEDDVCFDRESEDSDVVHEKRIEGDQGHEDHVKLVVQYAVHDFYAERAVFADRSAFVF